jgi:hypothetical protein
MTLFLNRNDEKWPHTRQIKIATSIVALNMVQLTPKQRTFVIKTFYETSTLQQARVAFGLINFA